MVNISLSTNSVEQVNRKEVMAKNGLVSVIVIFIVLVCIYGGLLFWQRDLDKKIGVAEEAYAAKYTELTSGRNIEVTDLQNRIFLSKELVAKENVTQAVLDEVEKTIVSGVYLDSYSSNKSAKKLNLKCMADNYDSVARQVLSFKSSKMFSNVSIGDAVVSEDGKVEFSINMKFN